MAQRVERTWSIASLRSVRTVLGRELTRRNGSSCSNCVLIALTFWTRLSDGDSAEFPLSPGIAGSLLVFLGSVAVACRASTWAGTSRLLSEHELFGCSP